jgi:hypothetical protein
LESYLIGCSESVRKSLGQGDKSLRILQKWNRSKILLGNSCTTDVNAGSSGKFCTEFLDNFVQYMGGNGLKTLCFVKSFVRGYDPWNCGELKLIIYSKISLCVSEKEDIRRLGKLGHTCVICSSKPRFCPYISFLSDSRNNIAPYFSVSLTPGRHAAPTLVLWQVHRFLNYTSGLQLQHDSDKHASYFPWHWKCLVLIRQPR